MSRLLPVLIALIGLAAGLGAGVALRPDRPGTENTGEATDGEVGEAIGEVAALSPPAGAAGGFDYIRLNNQFVVPVVTSGRVASLVILSINLEIAPGNSEQVYAREPKLRDGFLQVLFDHANAGGFSGDFLAPTRLAALRQALREQARHVLGPFVNDILITDMVRQDS